MRQAVQSGLFAVYEVFDGDRTVINVEPDFSTDAARASREPAGRTARVSLDRHSHSLLLAASGRAKIPVAPPSLAARFYRYLRSTFRFPL